jgi:type IV secretion system protein VirB10
MAGVLLTRGPDAILAKGSTIEMLLDRSIGFSESELNFGNYQAPRAAASTRPEPGKGKSGSSVPIPGRRFPD